MKKILKIDLRISLRKGDILEKEFQEFLSKIHCFEYDELTTIKELYFFLYESANYNPQEIGLDEIIDRFRFVVNDNFLSVNNLSVNLSDFLNYLKIQDTTINLCWIIGIGGGGEVERENGIKYFFHSNESNHLHQPHIHVSDGPTEMKVSLVDGRIIGKLENKKKQKEAIKKINKNREKLLQFWSDSTNGINVFIDADTLS